MSKRELFAKGEKLTAWSLSHFINTKTREEAIYGAELLASTFESKIYGGFWDWDTEKGELWTGKTFNYYDVGNNLEKMINDQIKYMNDNIAMVECYIHLFKGKKHKFASYFLRRIQREWKMIHEASDLQNKFKKKNSRRGGETRLQSIFLKFDSMIRYYNQINAYNRLVWRNAELSGWIHQAILETQRAQVELKTYGHFAEAMEHIYDTIGIIVDLTLEACKSAGNYFIDYEKIKVVEGAILRGEWLSEELDKVLSQNT